MADKKSPLGKGLSALISEESMKGVEEESFIPNLPIEKVLPNPDQPRLNVKPESLVELADSIREHGIIEPLIVSKRDGKYMLVAGERRWRGAQLAQLKSVPVVIKETTPQQMLELAIVENVQRKDLNPLEEALAFQQLNEEYNLSIPDISKKVGLSRPAVSNKIRLLQLPQQAKEALVHEKISEGHARALLGLENPQAITAALRIVMRDKLSVRATEDFVRKLNFEGKKYERQKPQRTAWSPEAMKIKDSLSTRFGTGISLTKTRRGGKIVIPFKDDNEITLNSFTPREQTFCPVFLGWRFVSVIYIPICREFTLDRIRWRRMGEFYNSVQYTRFSIELDGDQLRRRLERGHVELLFECSRSLGRYYDWNRTLPLLQGNDSVIKEID